MKQPRISLRLVLPVTALLLCGLPAGAVTFTYDTVVSFNNTNYDGESIIVTNCTLTVDGLHSFASLQVLNGATLTHSFAPNGLLENRRTITNQPQVLSATNAATLPNGDVVVSTIVVQALSGLVTYTNGADYVIGLDDNGMTTLLLTTNSAISEGSANLVAYDYLDTPVAAGLRLIVIGDVFVAQGGTVKVDGKGYDDGLGYGDGAGQSAGSPLSGSGAGHGGDGGQSVAFGATGASYDSIQQPVNLGSGGGRGYGGVGGAGGGSVRLVVGGNVRVEGMVSANGVNGINERSGGGSGGSIWLNCQNLSGAGVFSANGGDGEPSQGGGGGGGRISLQFTTDLSSAITQAHGGNGYVRGGAGTVYSRADGQFTGQVLVDNGGKSGMSTLLSSGEPFDLTVRGGAIIGLPGSMTFRNLLVASNAWIKPSNQLVTIEAIGNATIEPGGGINADGTGYAGNLGPGAGKYFSYPNDYTGGGGGYGGFGAAGGTTNSYGGMTYGSVIAPMDPGSGGGCYPAYGLGGAGGGVIRFDVTGMLLLDGRISADGGVGIGSGSGGGSGGSVWVTAGTLTGAGTISANGGMGNGFGLTGGGGGGGGRIAVQYGVDLFFGITTSRGGSGSGWGGAGTICTIANGQPYGQVLVDNGGQSGTNTSWSALETIDLTVKGGAAVSPPSSQLIGTLLVASNGWVSVGNQILTVTGSATIQAGGGIIADGKGNPGGVGPGAGKSAATPSGSIGGGGGYGGYGATGGAPSGYSDYGGNAYGSATEPADPGSGGGSYSNPLMGGAGGGVIRLHVTGVLQLDGRISASGSPGTVLNAGGGSGGSVALTVGTLTGSGVISANGGAGNSLGGGGGGGRIAIVCDANNFSGGVSAYGGGGYAWGGAGTIYYAKPNSHDPIQVVADNGGQAGTNTSFGNAFAGNINLTVKNGAVISAPTSLTLGNLLVMSNGWVSFGNQTLTVTGNATVQAGGGIIADGTGNRGGIGQGAGRNYSTGSGVVAGGGGYGGYGASGGGTTLAYGGITYGSLTTPVDLGSGGGGYTSTSGPSAVGGSGGGAIRLTVTGLLEVDGRISACGLGGAGPSAGGGSGGSILITVGTLGGSGLISANGGAGNSLGGGGGGGRIALVCGVYDFSGLVSTYGGSGYAVGGAGTVYIAANDQTSKQVVLDNGGQAGTNTSWAPAGNVDVTVRGGASLAFTTSQTIGNLLVTSNAWLVMVGNPGYTAPPLTVIGNATIQAGGGIIADGMGWFTVGTSGSGPGAGRSGELGSGYVGGGGGHGGYGASGGGTAYAYGGTTYGSVTAPVELGSQGGGRYSTSGPAATGGAGGGAIRLTVNGVLQVDGKVSACGLAGAGPSAGGGSGGSIYLTVGTLAGSGLISANGGMGKAYGGGGGGGRIAILYTGNTFAGLVSAYGGGGYASGGAGTIYTRASGQSQGLVAVDNGGQTGTNTSWAAAENMDVAVKGGAVLSVSGSPTIGNLLVASNGWVSSGFSQGLPSTLTLLVRGNVTIQAGGGIIADGTGYPGGQGQGAGSYSSSSGVFVSGGGGYGGYGASSGGSPAGRGGNTYGGVTPTIAGSGGGSNPSIYSSGGSGGGAISLNVTGTLQVDGRISAAGGAGISPNSGGGSGGGILLTVGTLAGSGVIAANGGAGNGLGGGGGGGRIAITYTTGAFSGLMSAYGGIGGYACGGAGTIYAKANRQPWGQVVVDNGGRAGTNTSWLSTGTIDLTVLGGAVVSPPGQQILGNLLVASNGWMSVGTQTLTVTSNATVQAEGGILADGTGYPGGQGPGAGKTSPLSSRSFGGGGGYGGFGAASGGTPAASGGSTYGLVTAPLDRGSGGGGGIALYPGGAGGGAIRLNVTGVLLLNGLISANGGAGIGQDAGGGSGGSVWLTVGTLAGAGTVSANGGMGNELGGGGGGGCISIQYGANAFEGITTAFGGGGFAWGGAGTVYTKASNQTTGQMLVDNGGRTGTNTPVPYLAPFDLTVQGGAVAFPSGPYLLLSNLFINTGASITCLPPQTNLEVAVLHIATIDVTASMVVDGKGFGVGTGPGAGLTSSFAMGSGAGYGGNGGASSLSPGGGTYGSAQQPVDRGSGGGRGAGVYAGGSEGGGAIRLTVGGALTVNGRLSAGGDDALQDDGGGGSGGSIWLTAGALAGAGAIAADGGAGELYDGGGGGGGRIAIYTPINTFSGRVSVAGGDGASPGQAGSIYYGSSINAPQIVSCTPAGPVNSAVSSLDLVFNTVINPASAWAGNFFLVAPAGVPVSGLVVTPVSLYHVQVSFPQQIAQGDYTVGVGPAIMDLSGQPMSQVYTSAFSIVWSVVEGRVTNTNGLPVPGVVLQPDSGIASTTTDTNGFYRLSLPPSGAFNVKPSAANLVFVPGTRTYVNVTGIVTNENYLGMSPITPALGARVAANTYVLTWYGVSGATYQLLCSTNLVDWLPYEGVLAGTNGPLQLLVPMGVAPMQFFRVHTGY